MLDPNFDATVVYLFDSEEGAGGVILNRPTDISLGQSLPALELAAAEPAVVFHGGPVRVEHALVLGVRQQRVEVLDFDAAAAGAPGSVRVFAGYAGWDDGQLEAEIAEGGWFVAAGTEADVLSPDPRGLWRAVMARQDGPLSRYATYPDDPRLN